MKALTWQGRGTIRCETLPDPQIQDGRDAIIKATVCAICGSDLHLMGGYVPAMEKGDVLGHECMGELTKGLGPDAVIEAVGMGSHGAEGRLGGDEQGHRHEARLRAEPGDPGLPAGGHGGLHEQGPDHEDGRDLYDTFREKKDDCIKAVFRPHG
jgi:threonine dehydrogenase-like Zn-dependent dehydrogenase